MRSWIATVVIAAGLAPAAWAEPTPLRYGLTSSTLRSIFALPVIVAAREGFFARENLAVTVVPIAGGTDRMIAALHEGTTDITHVSTPFLIRAVLGGSDAVAIAAEFANPIYSLVARPEIKTIAELRGKTIGQAAAADTIAITTRALLAAHGLNAGDYTTKEIVGTPGRFECLKRGDCDAVPLGQPADFLAAAQGFTSLGVTSDAAPRFVYTVSAARRSWLVAHADAATGFVRALAAAFRFIRDPTNRDAVARIIVATMDAPEDIARKILALYLDPDRGVLPKAAEIDLKDLAQVIAFMGDSDLARPLPPPERFVDPSFWNAAATAK